MPFGLQINNLTVAYERHPALHHLNVNIVGGSLIAIVGPNGAGKSTLLHTLAGLNRPTEGTITGPCLNRTGYLPQQSRLDRAFPINVHDLVAGGLWRHTGLFRRVTHCHRECISEAIEKVGLEGFENRLIGTLSGGQLQRALFARLIVQDSPIILLDEPFNAIDAGTAQHLLGLLHDWHGQSRTVLVVTHDLEQVREHFPHTLLLARELIDYGETATVLTFKNLQKASSLCESFDPRAPVCLQGAA